MPKKPTRRKKKTAKTTGAKWSAVFDLLVPSPCSEGQKIREFIVNAEAKGWDQRKMWRAASTGWRTMFINEVYENDIEPRRFDDDYLGNLHAIRDDYSTTAQTEFLKAVNVEIARQEAIEVWENEPGPTPVPVCTIKNRTLHVRWA